MNKLLTFTPTEQNPVCPHCQAELERLDYRREKLHLETPAVYTYVVILMCPKCRKVLGTQSWGF